MRDITEKVANKNNFSKLLSWKFYLNVLKFTSKCGQMNTNGKLINK